jgi:hypothetical protein
MRHVMLALCMAFGLAVAGLSAASAAPIGKGVAAASGLTQVQYAGYCERLRRACIYKEERGEWGRGNCHRYRVECGRANYCERLRQACRYKYERGEEGQGNCRRWKYECGGSSY